MLRKNENNEMIFLLLQKPARNLECIDYDLLGQDEGEDWVPNDDEADDDHHYLSVASGDRSLLQRYRIKDRVLR
jgi:hypothetical protein